MRDVRIDLFVANVFDRPGADQRNRIFRAPGQLPARGEHFLHLRVDGREFERVARRPADVRRRMALALQSADARVRVGGEARAAVLAVVEHVDAKLRLPANDLLGGNQDGALERSGIVRIARVPGVQRLQQLARARRLPTWVVRILRSLRFMSYDHGICAFFCSLSFRSSARRLSRRRFRPSRSRSSSPSRPAAAPTCSPASSPTSCATSSASR